MFLNNGSSSSSSSISPSPASSGGRVSNGLVGIRGGRVVVTDPVNGGSPALFFPGEKAVVTINGQESKTPFYAYAADKIEITPKNESIPASVEVDVAPDQMTANVRVQPRIIITRNIKDSPAREELLLRLREEREDFKEVTSEQIILALKDKGVVFGFQDELIEAIAEEADGAPHPAAKGQTPLKGEDGYVELTFKPGRTLVSYDEADLANVDYRERLILASVKEEELIAIIHPPVPGTPGMTITGKVLEPPEVKEAYARCEAGCKLVLDKKGAVIVATQSGRPLVMEEKLAEEGKNEFVFSVIPLFIHQDDVDLKSGNLRFKGDLKILGNVVEGMIVESWGSIEVVGHVAGSRLYCGGSAVFLNHLINSDINIGIYKDIYMKLSALLKELEEMFVDLQKNAEQIEQAFLERRGEDQRERSGGGNSDEGKLIRLLLERKGDRLTELCDEMIECLDNAKFTLPGSFENDLREIGSYILGRVCREEADLNEIFNVHRKIKDAGVFAQKEEKVVSDLSAAYVQHCQVRSGGNIKISGVGAYNSHFCTPMSMHVEGVFRGGSIDAGGDLFIGEAGSPAIPLKQCEIKLKQDSVARFNIVYENVRISFGEYAYIFTQTKEMVKVFYNQEFGRVTVTSLTKERK